MFGVSVSGLIDCVLSKFASFYHSRKVVESNKKLVMKSSCCILVLFLW